MGMMARIAVIELNRVSHQGIVVRLPLIIHVLLLNDCWIEESSKGVVGRPSPSTVQGHCDRRGIKAVGTGTRTSR